MGGWSESRLEKRERVTMGGKGKGEIGGEAGEVTGVVANGPTTDGLGKRYGTFIGWGVAAITSDISIPALEAQSQVFRHYWKTF